MTNLAGIVREQAAQPAQSGRPALRQDGQELTYGQLERGSGQAAAMLREAGVRSGDRVALMMPNVLAFPLLFYGALAAGAVVVPMNPLLKSREVAHYLGDSGASVIFAWDAAADEAAKGAADGGVPVIRVTEPDAQALLGGRAPLEDWAARADDDDAVILYTSGTTGVPKGAELTHANLLRNAEVTATTLLATGPGDVVMGCLPLFHGFGLTCGLNAAVLGGACLALLPRFDPGEALEMISQEKVTVFEGVPTMYAALLHHPDAAWPTCPRSGCACQAGPRFRSRSCAASRTRSAARSWRATGCPRRPRWRRSTIRTGPASRARSARRSPGCRCAWSTTPGPRYRRARSARS